MAVIRKTCVAISLAVMMVVSTGGAAWAGAGAERCIYLDNGMQACLP